MEIETRCLRHMWWPFRYRIGGPSRGKETPATFTLRKIKTLKLLEDQTLDYERVGEFPTPRDEYPLFYVALELEPPGIFIGRPWTADRWKPFALLNEDEMRKFTPNDKDGFRLAPVSMGVFCALLAKISHAYAAAELGLNSFHPKLAGYITGSNLRILEWVGGTIDPLPASDAFHEIGLHIETVGETTYVVVTLRLFAFLGAPAYRIVVGELQPSFDTLSLLQKPLHRIEMEPPVPPFNLRPVALDAWRTG